MDEGWPSDERLMQAYDYLEDIIADSMNPGNKRQKKNLPETQENDDKEERIVYAIERTKKVLQQRVDSLKAQDEIDAQMLEKNVG
jgi:hypothetical protein